MNMSNTNSISGSLDDDDDEFPWENGLWTRKERQICVNRTITHLEKSSVITVDMTQEQQSTAKYLGEIAKAMKLPPKFVPL